MNRFLVTGAGGFIGHHTFAACTLEICDQLELPAGQVHSTGGEVRTEGEGALAALFSGYRIWAELPVWH